MAEHGFAQVGHDPLAQRGDEIKTRRARQSEHGHDADEDGEIAVDQARTLAREAEIDHPPDRDRHDQSRDRRDHEDHQRRHRTPAIAGEIRHERQQRAELATRRRLGRGRLVRLLGRRPGRRRGLSLDDVHLIRPLQLRPKPDQSGATLPRRAAGGNRPLVKSAAALPAPEAVLMRARGHTVARWRSCGRAVAEFRRVGPGAPGLTPCFAGRPAL